MKTFFASLATCLVGLSLCTAAELSIQKSEQGVDVLIDGKLFTTYVTGDEVSNKPYFWPVIGPNGERMTRAFPMEDIEDERQDHPHHRSVWFGHQEIGGFDTWHEPLTMVERHLEKKKNQEAYDAAMQKLGSTVNAEVLRAEVVDGVAVLEVKSEYRSSADKLLLTDNRVFTFSVAEDGTRIMDVKQTLKGAGEGITLGDAKDSGFSVRVAHSMSVDAEEGGAIVNSAGDTDKDAWGQRAPWVTFSGPVAGDTMGVTMMNHPDSWRYPTPWHARTYGLFTANPFGLQSVAETGEDGSITLKEGEDITLIFRILFHKGDAKAAGIAEAWEAYKGS